MSYAAVEWNLRDMFRLLAAQRREGLARELPGLTIASAGTDFQMFNAAFFNSPVENQADLQRRLALASFTFRTRGLPWSLWVWEELLPVELRRTLARTCERGGLHFGSEMPGMVAEGIAGPPVAPELEIQPVSSDAHLREFCGIGSNCFRVPLPWFQEIFDTAERLSGHLKGWVGYHQGRAVSTAATMVSPNAIGVYNLATLSPLRERGFAEAMLRHAVHATALAAGARPIVLQATRQGLRLYERLGFRSVGRILVFPSR